ncbi:hypothetical protein QBC35DRAFT_239263 [Podospora australis]|uniref:D-xylose 1-dehydrogenase (NADP(+), D-xylono-1,5-lactone-forming) n=1 Tax=Podospora australis TaxID=1536484 RepID=A0AAN6WTM9_9PEZI|nr:hypothetical protein QBC35DRAFT_239263 [Podospora australis]
MSSVFGFLQRNWNIFSPPGAAPKAKDALRFGILGAAKIAPMALIAPAALHPEVIIAAVAARDRKKAEAFAKKHSIEKVFDTYQDLLNDPTIDAVYIPLPNGLHFEWALKALAAKKHVLLEKPSVSNLTEGQLLFHSPLLTNSPSSPVLLEAFHYRFHPSWILFLQQLDQPNIAHATATMQIPSVIFTKDDIRFKYNLSGGAMMDTAYTMSVLRGIFGAEAVAAEEVSVKKFEAPLDTLVDYAYSGKWKFPNGGTGEMVGSLQAGMGTVWKKFCVAEVVHKEQVVDTNTEKGEETVKVRKVALVNFIAAGAYHRVDVVDEFVTRKVGDKGKVVKKWVEKETKKAYTLKDVGIEGESKEFWLSYKYQLDALVDRIKGREGTGVWVSGEDSVNQARMVDMAYEKAGMPLRPTSEYRLEVERG